VKKHLLILLIISLGIARDGKCQSTVFSILQDQEKLAEKSYKDGNYAEAISLYQRLLDKHPADQNVRLKLAQCYYLFKNYEKSVSIYNSYMARKGDVLPWKDMYTYAGKLSNCH
jgi:outer membrane protein assembly factor BamD (BamD/ComL family)